ARRKPPLLQEREPRRHREWHVDQGGTHLAQPQARGIRSIVRGLEGRNPDLRFLDVGDDWIVKAARVEDVSRGDAVELAPGEVLDADARISPVETYAGVRVTELQRGRMVLEGVHEVEDALMPALERASDRAAEPEVR